MDEFAKLRTIQDRIDKRSDRLIAGGGKLNPVDIDAMNADMALLRAELQALSNDDNV